MSVKNAGGRQRRNRRRLFLAAYCSGILMLFLSMLYYGDSETFATLQCTVIRNIPHGIREHRHLSSPTATAPSDTWFQCCSEPELSSRLSPTVRYTSSESVTLAENAKLCVYGEGFGPKRGASTLTAAGVPFVDYESWTDPGPPYDGGRLAMACGSLSHWTPSGSAQVRLTTASGVSNGVAVNVNDGFVGVAAANMNRNVHSAFLVRAENRPPQATGIASLSALRLHP